MYQEVFLEALVYARRKGLSPTHLTWKSSLTCLELALEILAQQAKTRSIYWDTQRLVGRMPHHTASLLPGAH